MTKRPYSCSAIVVGTKYLGVFYAESEDEAIALALQSDKSNISLCYQCSVECEDAEIDEVFAEEVIEKHASN